MSDTPDTEAPEAEPWHYPPGEQTCASCGKVNLVPEQSPADLKAGVRWECSNPDCDNPRNLMKVDDPAVIGDDELLECGNCGATFSSNSALQPERDAAGWDCPVCDTHHANSGEAASTQETAQG